MIRILDPGVRSTVQDRGRITYLRSGVPVSGAADPFALRAANALVGNAEDAAAIEIVGASFAFSCDDRRVVAVTGRDVALSGRDRVSGWTAVFARGREEHRVISGERTRYAYLAVSGGIGLPLVLGSRSTYLPASIGPLARPLQAGDTLPLGASHEGVERAGRSLAAPSYGAEIRAMSGPHDDRLPGGATAFFASTFTASVASDRVGVRLEGGDVRGAGSEMLSCGIVAGAVQVPRGGAPIVLLADHQVTGGYPIVATVIGADLGRVAQAAVGEPLRFYEARLDEAVALRRDEERLLATVR